MPDDIVLNPGAGGAVLATDEISGRHFELIKINLGGDGVDGGMVTESNPFPVEEARSGASAVTSVAGSASSVTLLASNADRKGGTIYNDSTAILYLKLGASASTSSFTVKMFPEDYYEVPFNYTGIIDGVWASATGDARITELT